VILVSIWVLILVPDLVVDDIRCARVFCCVGTREELVSVLSGSLRMKKLKSDGENSKGRYGLEVAVEKRLEGSLRTCLDSADHHPATYDHGGGLGDRVSWCPQYKRLVFRAICSGQL